MRIYSDPCPKTLADIDKNGTVFVISSDKTEWVYHDRICDIAICRPLQDVTLVNLPIDAGVENAF
jgi:hypothetical protein